jgi:hypothetical protein
VRPQEPEHGEEGGYRYGWYVGVIAMDTDSSVRAFFDTFFPCCCVDAWTKKNNSQIEVSALRQALEALPGS